ncbi:adenylyl-sulfate kinase [Sedimenticola selenatireducens]|uniref:Adenylyl-sulfate kinase n=1 Tax=Sedimenticola selenatireducens TaxID=191960 RepID=A0A2N6D027_9GAMM|nr:adenylyl-sulfate kinase [Sedimenticola selenatireducens]PLX63023.1 MAG: adenylyl-sulfate kinase [Sedimenticola selenatireducens]
MDKNVVWHQPTVTRDRRAKNNGHKSVILWFTGLSGAGKSTIAHALEESLHKVGANTYVLDGDNVRHGLCGDLGFSDTDRNENIRRVGEVSKLFIDAGVIALSAFISPFRADRQRSRDLVDEGDFIEIHVKCPLEVCETRDPKGLYKKARAGLIKGYTGISSPYEEPEKPEIVIDTSEKNIDQCVEIIIEYLTRKQIIVPATLDRSASC